MGFWDVALRNEPLSSLKPKGGGRRGRRGRGRRTSPAQRSARAEHEREVLNKGIATVKGAGRTIASGAKELQQKTRKAWEAEKKRYAKEKRQRVALENKRKKAERKLQKSMKKPSRYKGSTFS